MYIGNEIKQTKLYTSACRFACSCKKSIMYNTAWEDGKLKHWSHDRSCATNRKPEEKRVQYIKTCAAVCNTCHSLLCNLKKKYILVLKAAACSITINMPSLENQHPLSETSCYFSVKVVDKCQVCTDAERGFQIKSEIIMQ